MWCNKNQQRCKDESAWFSLLILFVCAPSSSVHSPNRALKKRKATIATCSYFNTADVWTTANKQSLQMVQVQLPVSAGNKLTTFWISYTLTGNKPHSSITLDDFRSSKVSPVHLVQRTFSSRYTYTQLRRIALLPNKFVSGGKNWSTIIRSEAKFLATTSTLYISTPDTRLREYQRT